MAGVAVHVLFATLDLLPEKGSMSDSWQSSASTRPSSSTSSRLVSRAFLFTRASERRSLGGQDEGLNRLIPLHSSHHDLTFVVRG